MLECQNIEYKETWRDEYLKWLCGYANAQGGVLFIGKDDNGKTIGVENGKKLLEDLPNKIRDVLGVVAEVNLKSDADGDFIEIIVARTDYPVDYKGEYHYRCGSTRKQLTGTALARFLVHKTGFKWDAATVDGVSVDDLDKESFDIFRREARLTNRMDEQQLQLSNEQLLRHLHLMEGDKLKRAAVLLFHREPENWFTGVYTKIGKFTGAEIDYMDEVHGSLILQADRVIDLIYLKYLRGAISYRKDVRAETYPFARGAVREAVFNALCHSDWSRCVPIQVRIEEQQMYVSNMCMFPEGWTAETLMGDHDSMPHNPDIANTFYRAGFIEAWGRGIQRICEACDAVNAPRPEYIMRASDIMVRFRALGVTDRGSNNVTDKNDENAVIISLDKNRADKKVTDKGTNKSLANAVINDVSEISTTKKGTNRRPDKGTNKNLANAVINDVSEISTTKKGTNRKTENRNNSPILDDAQADRVANIILKKTTLKEYQVLVAITENPTATYPELMTRLGVGRKVISARIQSLKEKGLLLRVGNNRKGYWRIVVY